MRNHSLPVLAGSLCLALLIGGCGAAKHRMAAVRRPPVVPGEATAGPDLTGVKLPNFIMPLTNGPVSRPKPSLTPGAVAITNTATICTMSPHARVPIPFGLQTAVYNAYGYTTPAQQHKYILDYLIPIDLGGAPVATNIWPASTRGTGFYQKVQLDHILHDMVCGRAITLGHAQHALERDWYAAWLKYVVATGHI
jgi:hypothetical protein